MCKLSHVHISVDPLPQLTRDNKHVKHFTAVLKAEQIDLLTGYSFSSREFYMMYLLHKAKSFHFTNIWSCQKFSWLLVLPEM